MLYMPFDVIKGEMKMLFKNYSIQLKLQSKRYHNFKKSKATCFMKWLQFKTQKPNQKR